MHVNGYPFADGGRYSVGSNAHIRAHFIAGDFLQLQDFPLISSDCNKGGHERKGHFGDSPKSTAHPNLQRTNVFWQASIGDYLGYLHDRFSPEFHKETTFDKRTLRFFTRLKRETGFFCERYVAVATPRYTLRTRVYPTCLFRGDERHLLRRFPRITFTLPSINLTASSQAKFAKREWWNSYPLRTLHPFKCMHILFLNRYLLRHHAPNTATRKEIPRRLLG